MYESISCSVSNPGFFRKTLWISISPQIRIAQELFPLDQPIIWVKKTVIEDEIVLFTQDEVTGAVEKSKNRKAPGPDGLCMLRDFKIIL